MIKKSYQLNTVEISKENLIYNYKYLSKISGKKIAPVLKSNAYGHGISQIGKILDTQHPPFFCVDSIYEGMQLLAAHIKTPILIMGYVHREDLKMKQLPFSFVVYRYSMLEAIKKYQPYAGIHIFADTGFHREGVSLDSLPAFVNRVKELGLRIEGLMSHLGRAYQAESKETQEQVYHFLQAQKILQEHTIVPPYIHLLASSGILNNKQYQTGLSNVGRCGVSLYGFDEQGKDRNLKSVLELKSTIVQIKELKKGEKVGYDFTFTAEKNMKIAVLPMGFANSIDRRLSNKGFVKVRNIFCPIIGRVSMNLITIDVNEVTDVVEGDEVIVISRNPADKNYLMNIASVCETIPADILVHLDTYTNR